MTSVIANDCSLPHLLASVFLCLCVSSILSQSLSPQSVIVFLMYKGIKLRQCLTMDTRWQQWVLTNEFSSLPMGRSGHVLE